MLLHEAGGSLALPQLLKHLKDALPHFGSNEKQALKEILRRVARRDSRDSVVYAVLKDTTMREYALESAAASEPAASVTPSLDSMFVSAREQKHTEPEQPSIEPADRVNASLRRDAPADDPSRWRVDLDITTGQRREPPASAAFPLPPAAAAAFARAAPGSAAPGSAAPAPAFPAAATPVAAAAPASSCWRTDPVPPPGSPAAVAARSPGSANPAAAAPTPAAQPPLGLATEAAGMRLHLSSSSATGYKGVRRDGGRFQANICGGGQADYLGAFDTAVEAAVAYARAVEAAGAQSCYQRWEEAELTELYKAVSDEFAGDPVCYQGSSPATKEKWERITARVNLVGAPLSRKPAGCSGKYRREYGSAQPQPRWNPVEESALRAAVAASFGSGPVIYYFGRKGPAEAKWEAIADKVKTRSPYACSAKHRDILGTKRSSAGPSAAATSSSPASSSAAPPLRGLARFDRVVQLLKEQEKATLVLDDPHAGDANHANARAWNDRIAAGLRECLRPEGERWDYSR